MFSFKVYAKSVHVFILKETISIPDMKYECYRKYDIHNLAVDVNLCK